MKYIVLSIMLCMMFSCAPSSNHEVRYSPDNRDSVVYVQYVDQNGNSQEFWMNYLIFSTLMQRGGYSNVYNYHQSHYRTDPGYNYNVSRFQNYRPPVYYNSPSPSNSRYEEDSYVPTTRRYNPSIRSDPYRNTRTYRSSSPSVSPSRTYNQSSPSKSSYSPSRSYKPSISSRSSSTSRSYKPSYKK